MCGSVAGEAGERSHHLHLAAEGLLDDVNVSLCKGLVFSFGALVEEDALYGYFFLQLRGNGFEGELRLVFGEGAGGCSAYIRVGVVEERQERLGVYCV